MQKYCTKCGRLLQEEEACSCQQATVNAENRRQAAPKQNSSEPRMQTNHVSVKGEAVKQPHMPQGAAGQASPQASVLARNFFQMVLYFIKKPVFAGKDLIARGDMKSTALFIGFQGICSALFIMAAAQKCAQWIGAIAGLMGGSSSQANVVAGVFSMPYARIFIVTVLFSAALTCILALLAKLGHSVIKVPVSFQQMLSAAAVRSAVLAPAILVSLLVFELSVGIGILLFLVVNIWGYAVMIISMSSFMEPAKMNLFVQMISVAIILFVVIALVALSKVWTLYLPDLIRSAIKEMGGLSGRQLLQGLLEEIF